MLLITLLAQAAPLGVLGDLTFTEFQPEPGSLPDYQSQWFEIYNNSGANQDLIGVVIKNSTDDGANWQTHTITSTLLVAAGDYVVLGVNNDTDSNGGIPVDYVYPIFANESDYLNIGESQSWVQIWSSTGVLLDEVKWTPSWGFGGPASSQVSTNAYKLEWANDFPTNWCLSDGLYPNSIFDATPGQANAYCSVSPAEDLDSDGYAKNQGDCRDDDAYVNPGAIDAGTGDYYNTDDDCDGVRDDGETDDDGDGFTEVGGDCNDESNQVYPGARETVNSRDDDCNGCVDDLDDDGDGVTECEIGIDTNGDEIVDDIRYDCNDANNQINPNANEIPYDGIDQNCDAADLCDVDQDGYGAVGSVAPSLCEVQPERVTDCDDVNPNVNPATAEVPADLIDNDCDGIVDIPDQDDDGWTVDDGDCMDISAENLEGVENAAEIEALAAAVHPEAAEVCGDLIDNDCNGFADDDPSCWNAAGTATVRGGGMFCGMTDASPSFLLLPFAALLLRRRR